MRLSKSGSCPHCGFAGCSDRFQEYLALDYSDPAYLAVHHLLVPAYQLQHNRYADEVRVDVARFVLDYLFSPADDGARRRVRRLRARTPRIVSDAPPAPEVEWTMTIEDVDPATPDAYCRSVRNWAGAVAESILH